MLKIKNICILCGLFLSVVGFVEAGFELTEKTQVEFASVEKGREILCAEDYYVMNMSPFDRASRLQSDEPVSREDYLKFVAKSVVQWNESDKQKIEPILGRLRESIKGYGLELPKVVYLIKTTGDEEAGAAYTRGNGIFLPPGQLSNNQQVLEQLITHELFHVLTRHNVKSRDMLYEVIGFHKCNEIELPRSFKLIKISNPDAPYYDSYINVVYHGKTIQVVPALFSYSGKYEKSGGSFFDYLRFQLMVVEKRGEKLVPMLEDGELVMLDVMSVENYFEQIGKNTAYIIHPEEILADNFSYMFMKDKKFMSPEIIERLDAKFKEIKKLREEVSGDS